MTANPRKFEAVDPFDRKWTVSLRWLQNGITIRHADTVDVKWELLAGDGTTMEKVIALRHPDLLEVSRRLKRGLTDAWCIRLAAEHLRQVITTWEDAEKTIIAPSLDQIAGYGKKIESEALAEAR